MLLLAAMPTHLSPHQLRLLIQLLHVATLAGMLEPEDFSLQCIQKFGILRESLVVELVLSQNLSQVRVSILLIRTFQCVPVN